MALSVDALRADSSPPVLFLQEPHDHVFRTFCTLSALAASTTVADKYVGFDDRDNTLQTFFPVPLP